MERKIDEKRKAEIRAREQAATPDWMQATHVGEPKAIVSQLRPNESLLGLDRDGMAIFERVADAAFAAHARTDVPHLLADNDALAGEVDRLSAKLTAAVRVVAELKAARTDSSGFTEGWQRAVWHMERVLAGEALAAPVS